MIMGALPPAGNRIALKPDYTPLERYFPRWHFSTVGSGTQALAACLLDAGAGHPERNEVIVPGYSCPDLLAAILYCGYCPVVVDIQPDDSAFNLRALDDSLNPKTLAVIAVNVLGVAAPMADILALAHDAGAQVIEDNAQWFPDQHEIEQLSGDYVTFSMGRGKGISLLGGGLVLSRSPLTYPESTSLPFQRRSRTLKCRIYNAVTQPEFYGLIEKLPGLHLGRTEYHALESIVTLLPDWQPWIVANIEALWAKERTAQAVYHDELTPYNALKPMRDSHRVHRLLRYPFVFESRSTRDRALMALQQRRLGASAMYATDLSRVRGVVELGLDLPELPGAVDFSECLITLPTHDRVSAESARHISQVVRSFL